MRPNSNSTFDCHDPKQIRLKTRLRLDHVTSININSNTVFKIALILPLIPNMKLRQLLLGSPSYANERRTLLDKIRSINSCILQENDTIITKDLFFRISLLIKLQILLFQMQELTISSLPKGLLFQMMGLYGTIFKFLLTGLI